MPQIGCEQVRPLSGQGGADDRNSEGETAMQTWEYFIARIEKEGDELRFHPLEEAGLSLPPWKERSLTAFLNEVGSQGWELVALDTEHGSVNAVFKRPRAEAARPEQSAGTVEAPASLRMRWRRRRQEGTGGRNW